MACCFALGTEPLVFHSVTTKLVLKVYRTSAFPVKHYMSMFPWKLHVYVCVHCSLQVRASCVQLDIIASVIYAVVFTDGKHTVVLSL